MSFGSKTVPGTFQWKMDVFLSSVIWERAFVYLDEVAIFSKMSAKYIDHVRSVLTVLWETCVALKLKSVRVLHIVPLAWTRCLPRTFGKISSYIWHNTWLEATHDSRGAHISLWIMQYVPMTHSYFHACCSTSAHNTLKRTTNKVWTVDSWRGFGYEILLRPTNFTACTLRTTSYWKIYAVYWRLPWASQLCTPKRTRRLYEPTKWILAPLLRWRTALLRHNTQWTLRWSAVSTAAQPYSTGTKLPIRTDCGLS